MYNTFSFITSSLNLSSVISISVMRSCALVHLCSALFATLCLTQSVPCVCICQSRGPSIQNWVLYCKDFCPQLRSYSGGGATSRPSMEPSENQCLLPAALCVSGNIVCFQRTKIEVSTRSHCGPIEFTKCSSCFPCWPAASGDRNYFTRNTWGQSRETDSPSGACRSLEEPSQYISMGPAYGRERLQNSVRVPSTEVQWDSAHNCQPRAGWGYGYGSSVSLSEGGYRNFSSS